MTDEIEIPQDLYAEIAQEVDDAQDEGEGHDEYWLGLAADAFHTSTDYLDSNIRRQWEASIAHQNNEHAPGSKYYTDTYKARSRTFRPKTRTNNQAAEASFAKAMFSTNDLVSVTPENGNDQAQQASAEIVGYLMQHRLTKAIPWYQTAIGAYQEGRVYGVCFSYQYWDFEEVEEEPEPSGMMGGVMDAPDDPELEEGNPATNEYEVYGQSGHRPSEDNPAGDAWGISNQDGIEEHLPDPEPAPPRIRVLRDKPACDLLPPENVRFEPNADWRNPMNASPYVIRLVPMYANEAQHKAEANGWNEFTLSELIEAGSDLDTRSDQTRKQRQGEHRQDPSDQDGGERNEFTLVWLHENFIRVKGQDYVFWTVGTSLLLSEPEPIEDVYPHLAQDERPITMGVVTLEAHKNYPMSPTELVAPLQEQSNDITNQRIDNVRLVLNKRYIVRRQTGGGGIDLAALGRSTPGSSVMASNPTDDVRVLETNDVTSSSYQEQDRLDLALDELSGNFSQQSVQNNRNLNETVGGMEMMSAGASEISEYMIRTFIETWVEPTLSQLVRLEQYYETDETLLALAQQQSDQFQQFGETPQLDELLRQELTVNVNAGFGKTNPQQKLNSLNQAMSSVQFLPTALARVDEEEVIKEVFGNAGFRDGKRFFKPLEEFKKQNQGPNMEPDKEKELALKEQQQEFEQQMEQQRFQWEQQKFQAELSQKRELELMKMAKDYEVTLEQLKANLGIKAQENQTKREIEAGRQTNEQAEMLLQRQNLNQGHDTFG